MKLHIEPKVAMADEKNDIRISELAPYENVTVSASMHFPWAASEEYEAYASFTADANGTIDVSKQKPNSGTYDWVDSMGLISSMQKVRSKEANIAAGVSGEQSLFIDITVEHQNGKETISLERIFQQPDIKKEKINIPFIGELFYAGNPNYKTVILLGGSGDGDIAPLSLIAGPLAAHGFNVLTVGYYGGEGLPEKLQMVPIEYFEKVIAWIEENPLLNSDGIFLHGTSKGGELALLLASKYHVFSKVVANMPHAYCFAGLDGFLAADVSSWSYRGEALPFIHLDNNIFFEDMQKCITQNKPFSAACCYIEGLESADNREQSRIKVENAAADFLLISVGKDMIWNSYDGCQNIVSTLKENNYPHRCTLLSYEEMGHTSFPTPYIIPISESLEMKMSGGVFSTGGTLKDNAHGQCDSWVKTIEFFKN